MTLAPGAQAQGTPVEQAVKAAYLAKFPAYVSWPAGAATGSITICVVGDGAIGGLVQRAATGQRIEGKPLVVRRLATLDGRDACALAYLGASRRASLPALLNAAQRTAILTVTDARIGGNRGIIHFETIGGRVRFHIDEREAARRGIAISSKLLDLAQSVTPRSAP